MLYFIRGIVTVLFIFVFNEVMAANPLTFKDALNQAYQNNPELQATIDKAQAIRGYFVSSGCKLIPPSG